MELNDLTNVDLKKIEQAGVTNRVIQVIIAVGTSVVAACAISAVMFMIDMKGKIPAMNSTLQQVQQALPVLQQGVNDLRTDQKVIKAEQANMKEQIEDLKQEVKNHK